MEYVYHCKKNGRDYRINSDDSPQASNDYAWRRGVREYMDNYHASITRKGWTGTDEEFATEIDTHCVEALGRFVTGDVPGERAPADKMALTRRLAAQTGVPVEKLAAWLEKQATMGRAA